MDGCHVNDEFGGHIGAGETPNIFSHILSFYGEIESRAPTPSPVYAVWADSLFYSGLFEAVKDASTSLICGLIPNQTTRARNPATRFGT